jgi:hypothetical protein
MSEDNVPLRVFGANRNLEASHFTFQSNLGSVSPISSRWFGLFTWTT